MSGRQKAGGEDDKYGQIVTKSPVERLKQLLRSVSALTLNKTR